MAESIPDINEKRFLEDEKGSLQPKNGLGFESYWRR